MVKMAYFQIDADGKLTLAHAGDLKTLKEELAKQKAEQVKNGEEHIAELKKQLEDMKVETKHDEIRKLQLEVRIESTQKGIDELVLKQADDVFKFYEVKEIKLGKD